MTKGGWKIVPAAFFLLLNFSISQNRFLFCKQLIYFGMLLFLFQVLRGVSLARILPPAVAGISLLLFAHGLVQKYLLFPLILEKARTGPTFYDLAVRTRIESGRVFSIFPLPTLYAMVCAALLLFIVHSLFHSRGGWRWFWVIMALLGSWNLMLTKSFGGILGFSLGLITYFIVTRRFSPRLLVPTLVILFLALLIVVGMRFSESKSFEPVKFRLSNWFQASRLVGASPFLGVGLGNYPISVPRAIFPGEVTSIYAHNFLLQFAAETGIPMTLALMGIALALAYRYRRTWWQPERALFTSVLVLALFFNFVDVGSYFFSAGLILAICLSQSAPAPAKRSLYYLPLALCLVSWLYLDGADRMQQRADMLRSQDRKTEAERLYRKTLRFQPYSHQALIGLADLELAAGNLAGAQIHLERSLWLFPQSGYSHYLLSRIRYRQNLYLKSLFHAQKAVDSNKKYALYRQWYDLIRQTFQNQLDGRGS